MTKMVKVSSNSILLCYSSTIYSGTVYNFGMLYNDVDNVINKVNINGDSHIKLAMNNKDTEHSEIVEGKFLSAKISECGELEKLYIIKDKEKSEICIDMNENLYGYTFCITKTK